MLTVPQTVSTFSWVLIQPRPAAYAALLLPITCLKAVDANNTERYVLIVGSIQFAFAICLDTTVFDALFREDCRIYNRCKCRWTVFNTKLLDSVMVGARSRE